MQKKIRDGFWLIWEINFTKPKVIRNIHVSKKAFYTVNLQLYVPSTDMAVEIWFCKFLVCFSVPRLVKFYMSITWCITFQEDVGNIVNEIETCKVNKKHYEAKLKEQEKKIAELKNKLDKYKTEVKVNRFIYGHLEI